MLTHKKVIQEIRDRHSKASIGPWYWDARRVDMEDLPALMSQVGEVLNLGNATQYYPDSGSEPSEDNAKLISCAYNDIKTLLCLLEEYGTVDFGWSYPPGCSGPPDEQDENPPDPDCEVCRGTGIYYSAKRAKEIECHCWAHYDRGNSKIISCWRNMEFKSGWNLPPGLMHIPEEKKRVYDPGCEICHGKGQIDDWLIELERFRGALEDIASGDNTSTLKGAIAIAKVALDTECPCWKSYDPGDCDPRHEYTGED